MVTDEHLLSLAEASKAIPKVNGRRPSLCTVWRWCRRGIGGIHLEYAKIGRTIVTSKPALDRFFCALAAAEQGKITTPSRRLRPEVRRADDATAAVGIN